MQNALTNVYTFFRRGFNRYRRFVSKKLRFPFLSTCPVRKTHTRCRPRASCAAPKSKAAGTTPPRSGKESAATRAISPSSASLTICQDSVKPLLSQARTGLGHHSKHYFVAFVKLTRTKAWSSRAATVSSAGRKAIPTASVLCNSECRSGQRPSLSCTRTVQ